MEKDKWIEEVDRLGLLTMTNQKNNVVANYLDFLTALRLLPAEYAYATGCLYLQNHFDTLKQDNLIDILQILSDRLIASKSPQSRGTKLPADFKPDYLCGLFTKTINAKNHHEKVLSWFCDLVLPRCCPPPTAKQASTITPSIRLSKVFKTEELSWSKNYQDLLPDGFHFYNPSICGQYILLRSANYIIKYTPHPHYESWHESKKKFDTFTTIKTVNYIINQKDAANKTLEPRQLSSVPVPYEYGRVSGLEDMRLFYWPRKQSHYAICCSLEVTNPPLQRQCLVKINMDTGKVSHLVHLKGATHIGLERRAQKNWLPCICPETGDLLFIYGYCPFIVLRYDEKQGQCHVRNLSVPTMLNHWRGSAGPVYLPEQNMFVCLVHESAWPHYCHRLITIDQKLTQVTHVSDRFVFQDYLIEFSCGMQLVAGEEPKLRILYSVHDASAWEICLPLSYVLQLLKPLGAS